MSCDVRREKGTGVEHCFARGIIPCWQPAASKATSFLESVEAFSSRFQLSQKHGQKCKAELLAPAVSIVMVATGAAMTAATV